MTAVKNKSVHAQARDDTLVLRDAMIEAVFMHAPFDGWTPKALVAAENSVMDIFGEGAGYRAFPGGLADMATHASDYLDRKMLALLDDQDLASMKVRERVIAGVRARIEVCQPHKEAVRRLLGYLALPGKKPLAARLAWATCNRIWYAAGDNATDFNYYTKRGLLFPVYTTTSLYWLGDESADNEDTWGYLDRRISDVMKIPGYQARAMKALGNLPNPFRILKRPA